MIIIAQPIVHVWARTSLYPTNSRRDEKSLFLQCVWWC